MQVVLAFAVGLLFGIGLIVSGMTDPSKVQGFLDLAGVWDPSLGFVMGGAILVGLAAFRFAAGRKTSLLGEPMRLPTATAVDRRLVLGALAFGAGNLAYILETHAHADHVTSAGKLREVTGAIAAVPSGCGIGPEAMQLEGGDIIRFSHGEEILVLHTPGHTAGSMSYVWRGNVFSGDTLLIDGCGRTDFQGGSAEALYDSVTTKLFTLPDATRMWPGHDYKGQSVSTIGWEKQHNARLANRSCEQFAALMAGLNLPKPKLIDIAVAGNRKLGLPHGA